MATPRQHAIDIEKLSASIRRKMEMLRPLSIECCIYKVPDRLRQTKENAYTPQVVSIGPIHRRNKKLRAMEEHKIRYLEDFLELSQVDLEECFELVLKNEARLRNCYAHVIELSSENFVKMVLMDATFLIMVLLCNYFESLSKDADRLFEKPKMMHDIRYDLLLLENQLPFFILEDLFKLSKIQDVLEGSFDLSQQPYDPLTEETTMIIAASQFIKNGNFIHIPERELPPGAEHLLDLLRNLLKPADWNPQRKAAKSLHMPTARQLYQAGVKFEIGSNQNMFDIKFEEGILKIPPLSIHRHTELIFRNLLAFERTHCLDAIFSDYSDILKRLLVSSADVELLFQQGILEYLLPDAEEVSTLFHTAFAGIIISTSEYGYVDVINGLNEYCGVTWHSWKATWIHKYFKAPWAIFSFSAAVLLLVLTLVQAVCSVLQADSLCDYQLLIFMLLATLSHSYLSSLLHSLTSITFSSLLHQLVIQ